MKKIEFNVGGSSIDYFFPKERVKTKTQILEILLEATRYMLVNPKIAKKNTLGKIILVVDKMSRLFFLKKGKYFSIVFPFFVGQYDDKLFFSFENDIDIDSELISHTLSIIKGTSFHDICSLDFADPIYNIENVHNKNFWVFVRELLLNEDGYIRYDKDLEGYQEAKAKGEEHRHPLNHFDVFYTNSATYKIGMEKELTEADFIDLLDIRTDCKYLRH